MITQEEKHILLANLCARLPYHVKLHYTVNNYLMEIIGVDYKCGTVDILEWNKHRFTAVPVEDIKPYLRPMSTMTKEEEHEAILRWNEDFCDKRSIYHCYPRTAELYHMTHLDYLGLIEKGLALEAPEGIYPKTKWLYRLEYKDDTNGLWYNGNGNWCFEIGIGSIDGCKTKTLPMDYDERYKQDGRDWFSSCSKKEDLLHWYSLEDAEKLLANGFVFTRYLATEYHEYDLETVFIKETSINREVLDIFELFNSK